MKSPFWTSLACVAVVGGFSAGGAETIPWTLSQPLNPGRGDLRELESSQTYGLLPAGKSLRETGTLPPAGGQPGGVNLAPGGARTYTAQNAEVIRWTGETTGPTPVGAGPNAVANPSAGATVSTSPVLTEAEYAARVAGASPVNEFPAAQYSYWGAGQKDARLIADARGVRMLKRRGRISVKGTFSFNLQADFTSATPATVGTGVGAEDRFYDDGFVRIDASGNAAASTVFYGYNDPGQVTAVAPFTATFHRTSSLADGQIRGSRDKVVPGAEVNYEEVLGRFRFSRHGYANVGVFFSFGWQPLSLRDAANLAGPVALVTDTYLPATAPIPAPFAGTFTGLLNGVPIGNPLFPQAPAGRVLSAPAATGSVRNDLDGSLYALTMGPFVELPLHDRVMVMLGGGFGVMLANTTYSFAETVVVPGIPVVNRSGSNGALDVMFGGVARLNVHIALTEDLAWEIGAGYQHLGTSRQSVAGKGARLKIEHVWNLNTGLNWAF